MLKLLVVASAAQCVSAHSDWGEKCPHPLHLVESENAPFKAYDIDPADGKVTEAEVLSVYSTGVDDVPRAESDFQAKEAFKQIDLDDNGEVTELEFAKAGMTQLCGAPEAGTSGTCPSPFIMDGQADYYMLKSEHYELRPLSWRNMAGMDNEELRSFMRTHDVPFTVRTKVLDLHDKKGETKNTGCVPVPPSCHKPLEFQPASGTCAPPKPHYINPIINDAWIAPVSVVDGHHHDEKAPRVHQGVEMDPNDKLLVKERQAEEQALWNWEKVRKHTGH
jgi:hypothetical protein